MEWLLFWSKKTSQRQITNLFVESRATTTTEKRYSQIETEGLALLLGTLKNH